MTDSDALVAINQIFQNIFGRDNPFSLEQIAERFAFDLKLPQKVADLHGRETWADSIASGRYLTQQEMENSPSWVREKKPLRSMDELLALWQEINVMATERYSDSLNVRNSDTIYGCENILRCSNCYNSKNLIFCDSCSRSDFLLACQRSEGSNFCLRVDDSCKSSNSFSVSYSNTVVNSLFIQDCFDMHECLFCAHLAHHKYCIANMQFEKSEYFALKEQVIDWIFRSS